MRTGTTLQYLLTDHLGSVSAVLNASGGLVSEQRYLPFGGVRPIDQGITETDFAFTGQRNLAAVGLMDYNARWYGQTVGAFTQPDTIISNYMNPQVLNRFAYVVNNPTKYMDPSGNKFVAAPTGGCDWRNRNCDPILKRHEIPRVITYIHKEMIANAVGQLVKALANLNSNPNAGGLLTNARLTAAGSWANLVQPGGEWDHKPILTSPDTPEPAILEEPIYYSPVGDDQVRFDVWSNIHYGFVGTAAGFTGDELTAGAGAAQLISDIFLSQTRPTSQKDPFKEMNVWEQYDDPSDRAAILIGIELYNEFGLSVTPENIYFAVMASESLSVWEP